MQFEGVVWWSFRAVDESFGSVVDGSKGLIEISGSCSKYVQVVIAELLSRNFSGLRRKFTATQNYF